MTVRASTIRPGFLVSLKTNVSGNVRYFTNTLEAEHIVDGGAQRAKWETERTVTDPIEHEAAIKARSKVRTLVSGCCSQSAFGLLCPEARIEELLAAVEEARKVADDFNGGSNYSSVSVNVLIGKIAQDDAEATRAINSEVRDLLEGIKTGLTSLDVKTIRDNANRARELSQMLSPEAADSVSKAIELARETAKRIAKAQKSGDTAGLDVDWATVNAVHAQRLGFLDLDGGDTVAAAPAATSRGLDYAPVETIQQVKPKAASIEL